MPENIAAEGAMREIARLSRERDELRAKVAEMEEGATNRRPYRAIKIPGHLYEGTFHCPLCNHTATERFRRASAGKTVKRWCYGCRRQVHALAPENTKDG